MALTSFADPCKVLIQDHQLPHGSVAISVQLVQLGEGGLGPVNSAPGQVAALGVTWDSLDASCKDTSVMATAAKMTITSVTADVITGTLDFTFGSDHLSGTFSAPVCDTASGTGGNPVCS